MSQASARKPSVDGKEKADKNTKDKVETGSKEKGDAGSFCAACQNLVNPRETDCILLTLETDWGPRRPPDVYPC